MEYNLFCQVCRTSFQKVFFFRKHLLSYEHKQKLKDTFQEVILQTSDFVPYIVFVDPKARYAVNRPIAGLSLLTICFCSPSTCFYLCHVCEQKFAIKHVLGHMFSPDHYDNYINNVDPDKISFSWIPNMDMRAIPWSKLEQHLNKDEVKVVQMLHLPLKLIEELFSKTYHEVMQVLGEKDKFNRLFQDTLPKRMTINSYQKNSKRKHPLLGMQYLLECVYVGPGENVHYLCHLCKLTLASHMIIKHVLSFDHIYCYFKTLHPSSLLSKESYTDYKSMAPMMLDLAKQSEEIHGTENAHVKQVMLNRSDFKMVISKCYAEVLQKLGPIINDCLPVNVQPKKKLECSAVTTHQLPSDRKLRCILYCQSCTEVFLNLHMLRRHVLSEKHLQMLEKDFGEAALPDVYSDRVKISLDIFGYVNNRLKKSKPVVGASLVVTCITVSMKACPIHLCFACLLTFPARFLDQHFKSQKHLINTLMYQNPWRLPFAWEKPLDDDTLTRLALEEEMDRKQSEVVLKVFDIPQSIFLRLKCLDYSKVLNTLQYQHNVLWRKVPPRETFSKLHKNEKFPMLGKQFVVSYDCIVEKNYREITSLCLLCERKLTTNETEAHFFSREHVTAFLDCYHPGSLDSTTADKEILLDLAKQAANLHTNSNVQVVNLTKPLLEPYTYENAVHILVNAKQSQGGRNLKPSISLMEKLVTRTTNGNKTETQGFKTDDEKNSAIANRRERESENEKSDNKNTSTPKKRREMIEQEPSLMIISSNDTKIEKKTSPEMKKKTKMVETSEEVKKTCKNSDEAHTKTGNSGVKDVHAELNITLKHGDRKRAAPQDRCSDNELGRSPKRQQLWPEHHTSIDKSTNPPKSKLTEETTEKCGSSCKDLLMEAPPVSNTILNCNPADLKPIHLHESYCLIKPEEEVPNRLSRLNHHKTRLLVMDMEALEKGVVATETQAEKADILKSKEDPMACCEKVTESINNPTICLVASRRSEIIKDKAKPTVMKESNWRPSMSSKTGSALSCQTAPKAATNMPKASAADASETPKEINSTEKKMVSPKSNPKAAGIPKADEFKNIKSDQETLKTSPITAKENTKKLKVGLSYLVVVSWKQKKQVFCLLCSVKLNAPSHVCSTDHQYNYVKMMYPDWSAEPSEMDEKLKQTVSLLAEIEKTMPNSHEIKTIKVKRDIYKNLGGLSENRAVDILKKICGNKEWSSCAEALLRQELCSTWVVSSSDDEIPVESPRLPVPVVNPDNKSKRIHSSTHGSPKNPQSLPAVASMSQQDESEPGCKVKQAPICSVGPRKLETLLTPISTEKKDADSSESYFFLTQNQKEAEEVIGLSSVWECGGESLQTFFLCESCEEILSQHNIRDHIHSFDHKFKYVSKQHPGLLNSFWFEEDIPHFLKIDIFMNIIVHELSKREENMKCVHMGLEMYNAVCTARFDKALKIVRRIREEEKQSFIHKSISAKQQKCEPSNECYQATQKPSRS